MKLAKDFPILKPKVGKAAAGPVNNVNKHCRLTGTAPPEAAGTSAVKGDSFASAYPSTPFPFPLRVGPRPGEGRERGSDVRSGLAKREAARCCAGGTEGLREGPGV